MAENTNKRLTRYGRDGANYTSRATFDCFYDPENHDHVIIDYQVWWYTYICMILIYILFQPARENKILPSSLEPPSRHRDVHQLHLHVCLQVAKQHHHHHTDQVHHHHPRWQHYPHHDHHHHVFLLSKGIFTFFSSQQIHVHIFFFSANSCSHFFFSANSCSQATMDTWGSSVAARQSQVSWL